MSTAASPPLPLALVITELEVGGAEQALVHLATGLSRERFQPVVYSLKARPENDLLVRRLEDATILVHFLNVKSRWQLFGAVKKLAKLFRQQQPQLVQTFLYHANVVGTMAARRAKVPRVVTGIRVADPSHWRTRVERWLTPKMDKIVCVSQGVADFCRERGFPAQKLVVIPNGVDMSRFQNVQPIDLMELGPDIGQRAIVYVGRLDRQKGLDWLLDRVMPLVFQDLMQPTIPPGRELGPQVARRDYVPSHDLVLVGDGPERKNLLSTTKRTDVFLNVHFTGWRADVPRILA
ncbi:MAG TPA: glycosyltransferase, partial [Pirellulaceae bacterium]|nr:glycosyltransferase [Pirellulaceae bacterium]